MTELENKLNKLPEYIFHEHWLNKNKKNVIVSIWSFQKVCPQADRKIYGQLTKFSEDIRKLHPAPFIPTLIETILKLWGEPPVLDPMMGTGTTLFVATKMGLNAYGLDIEEKFVDLVKRRLSSRKLLIETGKFKVKKCDARKIPYPSDFFGTIVFSPPYFNTVKYSDNPYNIASINDYEKYLKEMKKVYSECLRVLKPKRKMIVIVKDLNRHGERIPLGADTIKLCQKVGFKLFDIIINKMGFLNHKLYHCVQMKQRRGHFQSFTVHEYILVFEK